MSCTPDPQKPWACFKSGSKSKDVSFTIRWECRVDPKVKIRIMWDKGPVVCHNVPTGNIGRSVTRSDCSVRWQETGTTEAWKYVVFQDDVKKAHDLITQALSALQKEIYDLTKGSTYTSISYWSQWVYRSCSFSFSGSFNNVNSTGSYPRGGSPMNSCVELRMGSINLNCKTADYYEIQQLTSVEYVPKNAVEGVVDGVPKDVIYKPIKPGDRVSLPQKYVGESNCGSDCARQHQGSGGSSRDGVQLMEAPQFVIRPDLNITRSGKVTIKQYYFYCQ